MGVIRTVFWNHRERRLRAGWRLILQVALLLVLLIALGLLTAGLGRGDVAAVVGAALYLAGGLGLSRLLARYLDRRPWADYGLHRDGAWWADLAFGLALGALLMTGLFGVERAAGWVRVTRAAAGSSAPGAARTVLVSLLVYLAIGVNEELAFRGYQLRNLAEGLTALRLGRRIALLLAWFLSSALFGLAHALNPNATALSTLNIVVAGLLLSLPFLLTGELALSIGLHVTWNLFQGTVYGFPVSGGAPTRHLLTIEQGGPEPWTGGAFGPEAGLLGLMATLVGCGLVVAWVGWRRGGLGLHEPLAEYRPRPRPEDLETLPDLAPETPLSA